MPGLVPCGDAGCGLIYAVRRVSRKPDCRLRRGRIRSSAKLRNCFVNRIIENVQIYKKNHKSVSKCQYGWFTGKRGPVRRYDVRGDVFATRLLIKVIFLNLIRVC